MSNKFPYNFLCGACTSAHQVEGDNFYNDWWQWEKQGFTEASGPACNHYHLFKQDFLLAKHLGHTAHRLSIEWSRLEKEKNIWNTDEWNHYKEVINELIGLGITPIVTLNHFTIPLWLANSGGWLNSESITLFARFAVKALSELGDKVQYWITINEPTVLALCGYYYGQYPPCRKKFNQTLIVLKNMLKSHVIIYRDMHECAKNISHILTPKIGLANAVSAFHACSPFSILDRLSAYNRSFFYNHSFIRSSIKGRVLIPGLEKERLAAKNALDFIGLNYYFRQFVRHETPFFKNLLGETCSLDHHPESGEITDMGWEIYPKGIYEVVKSFAKYRLPILITENGIATTDDSLRTRYIKEHLSELLHAIKEGIPVIGYLHWALLDNFEWDEGYSKRFGLIHVDFKTQTRSVKDSAQYYASVIKTGEVS